MKKYINSGIALVLTMGIILLLLIAGPAQAFVLGIEADTDTANIGDIVNFEVSVKIEAGDGVLPVNDLTLILDGPIIRSCLFDVSGSILSGCIGINSITRLDSTSFGYGYSPSFGYGYGYGYGYGNSNGELKYKIELDTTNYPVGTYTTELKVSIGNNVFSQSGDDLTIKSKKRHGGGREIPKEIQLTIEGNLSVISGDVFSFLLNSFPHKLVINKIDNGTIDLTIFSEPENINIRIPETSDVDIDGDGEIDLSIKALFIGKNSATLVIDSEKFITFKKEKSEKIEVIELESTKLKDTQMQEAQIRDNLILELFRNPFSVLILFIINIIMIELAAIISIIKKR